MTTDALVMSAPVPRRGRPGPGGRADRRALTGDSIEPVLLCIGGLYALLGAARPLFAPRDPGLVLLMIDEALAVLLVSAWVACRRPAVHRWVQRHAQGVGLALCLLSTVDLAGGLATVGLPGQSGGCMILVMTTAALLQHARYAALVVGVCLAQWFTLAAVEGLSGEWLLVSVMVAVSAVIAGVLNASRRRTADQLVEAQDAIRAAALTDELTGLTNRRGLLEACRDQLGPTATARPPSLLLLDVDGLKAVNDLHGHAAGDRLLVVAAAALRAATRPGDVVARLGGDEFAVLLPATCPERAGAVRERVDRALRDVGASASTGLAQAVPGAAVEQLFADADADMYAIKRLRQGDARTTARTTGGGPFGDLGAAGPVGRAPTGTGWRQPPDPAQADLRGLCTAGAWVHLAMVPLHLVLAPASAAPALAVMSLALAVVLGAVAGAHAWAPTRALVQRHVSGLITAVLGAVCVETLVHTWLVGRVWASTTVIAAVFLSAALARSRRSAVLVSVGTALAWAALVASGAVRGDWAFHAVNTATAPLIGLLLHGIQRRTVTRLTAAQAQLRAAALTDELTGLTNRRAFLSAGRERLDPAGDPAAAAGLLFVDLDGLKLVNDTRGHAAGDAFIVAAADVLLSVLQPRELCARYGGDEFTLLLGERGHRHAEDRARAVAAAMAAAGVPVSIGSALPGPGDTIEALVARADHDMYERRSLARAVSATADEMAARTSRQPTGT